MSELFTTKLKRYPQSGAMIYIPQMVLDDPAFSFKDGEILPGMKKRGELAYLVPSDATDLKFLYQFDLFTGTTAVFDIK